MTNLSSPLPTTQLGRSGLSVSKICLGTMTFGEQNSEAEAHSQLDYALERGINFIDTAEMYPVMPRGETQGSTERYIGSWLKKSGQRDKVILATKIAGPSRGFEWIRNGENDLTPENIRAAVETSLQRLQTDYIDLYQLHWPSRNAPIFGQKSFNPKLERPAAPIEATLQALDELVRAGKVRAVGISNETAWGVSAFIKLAEQHSQVRIATIQNAYHLLNRSFENGLDEMCYREQVSLLGYSPLAFGQLTAKYIDNPQAHGRLTLFPQTWSPRYVRPTVFEAVRRYAQLARAHGLTPTQMALAWSYSRWFVASTIIGATSLQQLQENIDALHVVLSPEVLAGIEGIHAAMNNPAQ